MRTVLVYGGRCTDGPEDMASRGISSRCRWHHLRGSGIPVVARDLFSRTLREARAGVELVASDVGGYVQRLKRHPGKGICLVGGVELASSLFEAGIIDEVSLNVHPVLFGSGIPFSRHESAVSASN
jgi:dihydrofolate reductase